VCKQTGILPIYDIFKSGEHYDSFSRELPVHRAVFNIDTSIEHTESLVSHKR